MPSELRCEDFRLRIANSKTRAGNFQFSIFNFQFSISLVVAAVFVVLAPDTVLAADLFPRGPGFYFSIPKLLTLLLVYLCWVRTCWWINRDASALKLPVAIWNPLVFGSGLLGLLVVWLLPWYWLASLP